MTTILKLSAVISLCLVVNACSPAAAPKHETSAADGTVTNGVVTYSATDFHESSPGRSGGTLRVSAASDAGSFDVHALSNGNIQWMGRILFDCLVYQDEQGNISPWLARSWDISDDGKTYTFHLRDDVTYDNWSLAPRVGVRYEFNPQLQVFANVSRSVDPPASWEYSGSGPTTPYVRPLVEQKANTVEVGIKGSSGIFDGSLALYRSWVKDELLNVQIIPATSTAAAVTGAFNATPTIHQGIEAGLNTRLWENTSGEKITLRQVYTYNDFYYRHDPTFGDNQLPGIPKHIYQGEVQYQHPAGFYTGVNVQSASRTAVDYANSFYAPSYTIFGANVGYETPSKDWKVSLDLKNLTNQKYVTAVQPLYDAKGQDTASLYPGDGIGAYVAVEMRY